MSQPVALSVQITQIDHILTPPGPLDNSVLPRIPVIRIFGSSSVGQRTCLHIHQIYPYFFVDYNGKLHSTSVKRYISRLTQSLNHAIALSLKRDPHSPRAQFIRQIFLVKGIHFYGFHCSYTPFLKIYMADPACLKRAVTIMQSGTVMSTRFHVFESHLSYILQFMCDFGLYGCGWIDLGDVLQRDVQGSVEGLGTDMNTPAFKPSPYFRQSRMLLEMDAIAPQILNRHRITPRNLHHNLQIPTPPLAAQPLVLSVRELWEDERRRRATYGLNPSPELPVDPSDQSRGPGGEWVAECQWWEELRKRMEKDTDAAIPVLAHSRDWEGWVMTTFESIEALWEEPWTVWKPGAWLNPPTLPAKERSTGGSMESHDSHWNDLEEISEQEQDAIDVDISMLSRHEITRMIEFEEEDWEKSSADDDPGLEDNPEDDLLQSQDFEEDIDHESNSDLDLNSKHDPFQQDSTSSSPPGLEFSLPSPPPCPNFDSRSRTPETPSRLAGQPNSLWAKSPDANPLSLKTSISVENGVRETATSDQLDMEMTTEQSDGVADLLRPRKRRKLSFSFERKDLETFSSSPLPVSVQIQEARHTIINRVEQAHVCRTLKAINTNRYIYLHPPPSTSALLTSLDEHSVPPKIYQSPYYSLADDLPENPREYAGLIYHIGGGGGIKDLENWDVATELNLPLENMSPLPGIVIEGWEYASFPPSAKQIRSWLALENEDERPANEYIKMKSQIEGPTQANMYGLKNTHTQERVHNFTRQRQSMSVLALEVFVPTREGKVPDPNIDQIAVVFFAYQISEENPSQKHKGMIVAQCAPFSQHRIRDYEIDVVANEVDLINKVIDIVVDFDPDILVGWEVQRASWGYLDARGIQHGFDLSELISRAVPSYGSSSDQWDLRHASTFKVAGRHLFNLWRIMRSEQNLNNYMFENVVFHTLRRRVPRYNHRTLTEWYHSSVPSHTVQILRYFSERTSLLLDILERSEMITKTAEFARIFGVDFFSVISRGSQFKVESFIFRIAKPESFVLLSPNREDVGKQNAAECMPLIMEPISAFYTSPLVVLDFQSLYPSIMIAYNYCYSTCLGRVKDFQGRNKLGVTDIDLPQGLLVTLNDHICVSPNGIIYVKPEVRRGLLGRMLVELLETRVMVKQAMKGLGNDKALRRVLDARQLGLKYIANVTYGYTSATFSGRMPAVEIADSIVQSGRETLEKAIMLINSTKKWGAEVVYGDTDSMFISLPGKTKDQAFQIGNDIATTITALNPSPVKLKFEKVYLPCILLAKKRYVGFKYENIDDRNPVFDAKGIETVRRDGVPGQQKMVETCLKKLFRTQNLSDIKEYCCRSWTKLLENRISIQDFMFAKEVRMGTYSQKGHPPPGVIVAAKRMLRDPNDEPQYGDRIPYVITKGQPGSRLAERAMDPIEVLNNSSLRLDAMYYISRVLIPPLDRIFSLVGVDVGGWFDEMRKPQSSSDLSLSPTKRTDVHETGRSDIDEHFYDSQCLVCGDYALQGLCAECYISQQETIAKLSTKVQVNEMRLIDAHRVCVTCTGCQPSDPIRCESIDCPWLYSRKRAEIKSEELETIEELLGDLGSSGTDTPYSSDDVLDEDAKYRTPRRDRRSMS